MLELAIRYAEPPNSLRISIISADPIIILSVVGVSDCRPARLRSKNYENVNFSLEDGGY